MPVLNNVTVPDQYDPSGKDATIMDVVPVPNGGGWFSLAQNGNSAFCEVQYGTGLYGSGGWGDETILGSGAYGTIPPNATGIRFRNAVAGKAAVVTAVLVPKDVPALGVSSLGTVNVITGATLNFQHNDLFVAAEPTADFEDAANVLSWSVVDDPANTRVKVTPSFPASVIFPGTIALGGLSDLVLARATLNTVVSLQISNLLGFSNGGTPNSLATQGLAAWSSVYSSIAAAAGTNVFAAGVVGDTTYRLLVSAAGVMTWGTGAVAGDTSLQRSAAVPPSPGQVGLTTQQAFQSTNTTGGFIYTAALNNSALLSFISSADTQPVFKVFTQGALAWGPGGASALDLELARVTNSPTGTGTFLELIALGGAFGYGTGNGGAATIAAGGSGTINKAAGTVTGSAGIAAGNTANYTVLNSLVGARDVVIVNVLNGGTGIADIVYVTSIGAGTFTIVWKNNAVGTVTPVFNFAIIKGSNA